MKFEFHERSLFLSLWMSFVLVWWVYNGKEILVCIVSGSELLQFISLNPVCYLSNDKVRPFAFFVKCTWLHMIAVLDWNVDFILDWNSGLEFWIGNLDWNNGLEFWIESLLVILDWTSALEFRIEKWGILNYWNTIIAKW